MEWLEKQGRESQTNFLRRPKSPGKRVLRSGQSAIEQNERRQGTVQRDEEKGRIPAQATPKLFPYAGDKRHGTNGIPRSSAPELQPSQALSPAVLPTWGSKEQPPNRLSTGRVGAVRLEQILHQVCRTERCDTCLSTRQQRIQLDDLR